MFRIILISCFMLYCNFLHAQNWQLVWEDDFDGIDLDLSKWMHEYGTGSQYNMWGWGNGEKQYYQAQNTTLSNGIATIEVKEEPGGIIDSWGATSYYSSSKISTKGIFDFRYGKVEARMKTIDGQGFWPAFWMLPTNGSWPCDGEIDIMEQWGGNYFTNGTTGAAHLGTCPYSQSSHFYQNFSTYISSGSYADEFHTYSVIWKEDTITWFVDDNEIFSIDPSSYWSVPSQHDWPFNSNQWYIMINLAITQGGPNANTVFPNQIQVDYVRVYQDNITAISDVTSDANFITYSQDYLSFENRDYKNLLIFNLDGRITSNHDINGKTKVNVGYLNSGMYIIEIEDFDGNKINKKVIIK
ncbi:MAG: family 16 glycosylhydrolase [Flavobacteriales bacterium]|nr:family 16 glycosylhydrolase [Flavobacteriales bacterium]MDG2086307.1 family 16 glycosylhydrolase [Flavobacteriales bacterium]